MTYRYQLTAPLPARVRGPAYLAGSTVMYGHGGPPVTVDNHRPVWTASVVRMVGREEASSEVV